MDIHENLCSSIALLEYLQARGYLTTLDSANVDLKSCGFLQIIHLRQMVERNLGLIQLTEEQSGIKSFEHYLTSLEQPHHILPTHFHLYLFNLQNSVLSIIP